MKIRLYDHRETYTDRFTRDLGKIKKFSINARGELRISKTDLLYSLYIKFTKAELAELRLKLNELHDKKSRGRDSLVLTQVQEILKMKEGRI